MGRNFADAGNDKRKWQCFVCGRNHDDALSFKDHVITEHDEGREYIKCPVCDYPVRDMKLHFKCKHPNRVMPKNLQMRVQVWKDFAPNGKKRGKTRTNARQGYFPSKKMGKDIWYRSGFECEFYEGLEQDADILGFHAEPFKVPYYFGGKWHDYIPDLKVDYIDGTSEIWEIKPDAHVDYAQNQAKFAAMNDYAANMGWVFIVQTQDALEQLRVKVNKQKVRLNRLVEGS